MNDRFRHNSAYPHKRKRWLAREMLTVAKPYSLLFLGSQTFNGTLSLNDSIDCWQQITVVLHNCLKSLKHIDYSFRDNNPVRADFFYERLPKVEAVLFWGIPQTWMQYDHRRLKRTTECRVIITICECVLAEHSDWRFAFREEGRSTTRVDAPVWKRLYSQHSKYPNSVLIDHWHQDASCDWTYKIETWLQDLTHEFQISRYVQKESAAQLRARGCGLAHMKLIGRMPFPQWLAATDQLETFIVTHFESYGYAILDMFARGTRVLCPEPFLPPHFKNKFHIETFGTKDELIALLCAQPNATELIGNSGGLSDWSDVVKLIDEKFQNLLTRRSRGLSERTFGRDHLLRDPLDFLRK